MTVTEFTQKVKWDLLFDFNVLLRTSRGWDDTNARQLLDFAIGHNRDHNLHFQLGNGNNQSNNLLKCISSLIFFFGLKLDLLRQSSLV